MGWPLSGFSNNDAEQHSLAKPIDRSAGRHSFHFRGCIWATTTFGETSAKPRRFYPALPSRVRRTRRLCCSFQSRSFLLLLWFGSTLQPIPVLSCKTKQTPTQPIDKQFTRLETSQICYSCWSRVLAILVNWPCFDIKLNGREGCTANPHCLGDERIGAVRLASAWPRRLVSDSVSFTLSQIRLSRGASTAWMTAWMRYWKTVRRRQAVG